MERDRESKRGWGSLGESEGDGCWSDTIKLTGVWAALDDCWLVDGCWLALDSLSWSTPCLTRSWVDDSGRYFVSKHCLIWILATKFGRDIYLQDSDNTFVWDCRVRFNVYKLASPILAFDLQDDARVTRISLQNVFKTQIDGFHESTSVDESPGSSVTGRLFWPTRTSTRFVLSAILMLPWGPRGDCSIVYTCFPGQRIRNCQMPHPRANLIDQYSLDPRGLARDWILGHAIDRCITHKYIHT